MHWARRAASRADCTAGSNKAINTAMIAMTTKSSMSVKARGAGRLHAAGRCQGVFPPEESLQGRIVMESRHANNARGGEQTNLTVNFD